MMVRENAADEVHILMEPSLQTCNTTSVANLFSRICCFSDASFPGGECRMYRDGTWGSGRYVDILSLLHFPITSSHG